MPIYNGEALLTKCIDSILVQNYTDFELILVDDGSTDGSLNICREYEQKDDRVVVFHKENAGLVATRKSGLSVAKGEYIGFIDCDDYIDKNMYSDLMEAAEKDNADIVVSNIVVEYINRPMTQKNMIPVGFYDRESIEQNVIPKMLTHSGFVKFGIIPGVVVKVFRREVLEKALPCVFDSINIGEDVAITAYSFMNAQSVSVIESAAYHYVQGDESMIRKFNPKRLEYINNLKDCLSAIDNADYKKQIDIFMSYLIFGMVAECVSKSGYNKKDMSKAIKSILNSDLAKESLKNADTSRLSKKDKIKIFLMRHKLVCALILLLRRTA